jgi:hypothetical protein
MEKKPTQRDLAADLLGRVVAAREELAVGSPFQTAAILADLEDELAAALVLSEEQEAS